MKKAYKGFFAFLENLVTFLMISVTLCVLLQVIARFVIKIPIPWTEELARYLLIMVCFLGGIIVSKDGEQLGAYFIRDRFKGKARAVVYIFNSVVSLFFLVIILKGCWGMLIKNLDQTAVTMSWFSNAYLYAAELLGFAIMIVFVLRDIVLSIQVLRGKREITSEGKSSPFSEEDYL